MKQSNKTNAVLSVMLSVGMCTTAMGAVATTAPQEAYASPASSSTAKTAHTSPTPSAKTAQKPTTPSAASPAQALRAVSGTASGATHLVTAAHDTGASAHDDKKIDFKDPILKARLLSVMKAKKTH